MEPLFYALVLRLCQATMVLSRQEQRRSFLKVVERCLGPLDFGWAFPRSIRHRSPSCCKIFALVIIAVVPSPKGTVKRRSCHLGTLPDHGDSIQDAAPSPAEGSARAVHRH